MQFSDDNARTWSNPRQVTAGQLGAHRTRAIWRRLGRSRKRLYRIRVTHVLASVAAGGTTFDDGLRVRQVPFHPRPCAPLDDRAQQALEET